MHPFPAKGGPALTLDTTITDAIIMAQLDCVARFSPAQWGEDWILLPTLLTARASHKPARQGRFVELGAYNGVELSNSLMLERCFNFTGVLIEANPANYAKLARSGRSARTVHSAVCPGSGFQDNGARTTAPITVTGMAVAGTPTVFTQRYISIHRAGDNLTDVVDVPCASLQSILNLPAMPGTGSPTGTRHHDTHQGSTKQQTWLRGPKFDALFLDVEGSEEAVMKTVDPSAFGIIMIETDGSDMAREERISAYVKAAGLRRAEHLRVYSSTIFVHPAVVEVPWPWAWPYRRARGHNVSEAGVMFRGDCGETPFTEGRSCAAADKGAWRVHRGVQQSQSRASHGDSRITDFNSCAQHCLQACGVSKCQFISFDANKGRCAWHRTCDTPNPGETDMFGPFTVRTDALIQSSLLAEPMVA